MAGSAALPKLVVPIRPLQMLRLDAGRRQPEAVTEEPTGASQPFPSKRRLFIGREIVLSGELTNCELLSVEGTVVLRLRKGGTLEIAEGGCFRGHSEVEDAEIRGRLEGELVVRGTLRLRPSGRISGHIRCGCIEVEKGGQVSGVIEILGRGDPAKTAG
ncbi:bactofilin family protein [Arenibaculum pallidiluteum]|uniref:bactofilin family protein n=1 Tax=Arenibaculum pallidiluteum TaxID=2812559 RepID=UPI001A96D4F5|nr:polymer-forming cytoskeletal protein [Arenibaculum pallidiluteum]